MDGTLSRPDDPLKSVFSLHIPNSLLLLRHLLSSESSPISTLTYTVGLHIGWFYFPAKKMSWDFKKKKNHKVESTTETNRLPRTWEHCVILKIDVLPSMLVHGYELSDQASHRLMRCLVVPKTEANRIRRRRKQRNQRTINSRQDRRRVAIPQVSENYITLVFLLLLQLLRNQR